jgi:glycyl-tRNA synthetase beta chain
MASPLRRQGPLRESGTQGVELAAAFAGATEFDVALLNALEAAEPKLQQLQSRRKNFEGAMAALASLRAPIDAFFESVMVNDPDPTKAGVQVGIAGKVP